MEKLLILLLPALLTLVAVRWLLLPLRGFCRLILHCSCGFACLWLLNTTAPLTGIQLPMNAVTVLTAGTLGLPGVGIVVLLAVL